MLLSHTGKIYYRIIEKRLRSCVEESLAEGQHGFRPGRGSSDLIFAMKMILEKSWEWNKENISCLLIWKRLSKVFKGVHWGQF